MKRLLVVSASAMLCAHVAAAALVFVDADHAGGTGTRDKPFATIAEAQRSAGLGGIIYVAEAGKPYEENVALAKGQMLIGSAYGLDAVRDELHLTLPPDTSPLPAAQGTGPVIHGSVTVAGDNVVAGCTITSDRKTGAALVADAPQGELTLRKLWIQTRDDVYGLYVGNAVGKTSWVGGGLTAADHGSGILIDGGQADVTFDHVPIDGSFATGIEIRNRTGGTVLFHNASPLKMRDVSRVAVSVIGCGGTIRFDSPVQVQTVGGRGVVVNGTGTFAMSGGSSWIESTNAVALDLRNVKTDVVLTHVSATALAPGQLIDGIIVDKVRGKFEIAGQEGRAASGGTIANAVAYAVRITQSAGVRIRGLSVTGGGTQAAKEDCPEDVAAQTNLRCRAALYLRHVEEAAFEDVAIDGSAAVGLNANNIGSVSFNGLRITNTGDQAGEPSVLIDEVRGSITFTRCVIGGAKAGGIAVEQRFNTGRIGLELCEIGTEQRSAGALPLIRVNVGGGAGLSLKLNDSRIHDPFGVSTAPLVAVHAADRATACIAVDGTRFMGGGAAARLSSTAEAKLQIAGDAASFASRNGGAALVTEGPVDVVAACP